MKINFIPINPKGSIQILLGLFIVLSQSTYGASSPSPVFGKYPVEWTDQVNVNYNTDTYVLSSSINTNSWNKGAASINTIKANEDGNISFHPNNYTYTAVGLSYTNANQSYSTINFSFYLTSAHTLFIKENGTTKMSLGTYTTGDSLQIERVGSRINYIFKGLIVRYVTCNPSSILIADVALYNSSSEIGPVNMSAGIDHTTYWTDFVNVNYNQTTEVLSNSGSGGWGTSGAASLNTINPNEDGYYTHIINSVSRTMIGLSSSNIDEEYKTIEYAFYIDPSSNLYIYENGTYKASIGRYSIGDMLKIERIGSTIFYKLNNVPVGTTVGINSSNELIVDVSFNGAVSIGAVNLSKGLAPIKDEYHPLSPKIDGDIYVVSDGRLKISMDNKYGFESTLEFIVYPESLLDDATNWDNTNFNVITKKIGNNRFELDFTNLISDDTIYVFEYRDDKGKKYFLKFYLDNVSF